MPESVRTADYFYVMVPDKPGEGARILGAREDFVNLDLGPRRQQHVEKPRLGCGEADVIALSAAHPGQEPVLLQEIFGKNAERAVAKRNKWKVTGPKRAFLIEGDDRVGACADVLGRLAGAKINVTAMDAVAVGGGRYGAILWVKARDVKKAASVLGAM